MTRGPAPDSDPILLRADALERGGDVGGAVALLVEALAERPDDLPLKGAFAKRAARLQVRSASHDFKSALALCLEDERLDQGGLQTLWLSILRNDPEFGAFAAIAASGNDEAVCTQSLGALRSILSARLLVVGMPRLFSADPVIETALTRIRRQLLEASEQTDLQPFEAFLSGLALHCFHNEYVFAETTGERAAVTAIERTLEGRGAGFDAADWPLAALVASYTPLYRTAFAGALASTKPPPVYADLVRRQLDEPIRELTIARTVPALTPVDGPASCMVARQYEDSPYPRWLSAPAPHGAPEGMGPCDILDAGCGSGWSSVMWARAFPNARVSGVDLSRASLAYAKRKADELGLANVDFTQGDILALGAWERRFDFIASSGVLHHLDDPSKGLAALKALLRPGGVMFLALYSEAARASIVAARQWIKEHDLGSDDDAIRAFRAYLFSCPENDPLKDFLSRHDFYATSNCRDLAFNVIEHRYTCLSLKALLDENGLEFLGFGALPPRVAQAYRTAYPADLQMRNLATWHEFEKKNAATFRKMYSFWCRPAAAGEAPPPPWLGARLAYAGQAL